VQQELPFSYIFYRRLVFLGEPHGVELGLEVGGCVLEFVSYDLYGLGGMPSFSMKQRCLKPL
jgi:hypothetical protein